MRRIKALHFALAYGDSLCDVKYASTVSLSTKQGP